MQILAASTLRLPKMVVAAMVLGGVGDRTAWRQSAPGLPVMQPGYDESSNICR